MSKKYCLDAVTRRALFGHEDATQEIPDRLSDYFIRRGDFETIHSSLPFCIVVGRKGTGKSAILRYSDWCNNHDKSLSRISVWLRPDDITEMYKEINDALPVEEIMLFWKKGIARCIASKILSEIRIGLSGDAAQVLQWAYEKGYKSRDIVSSLAKNLMASIKTPIGEINMGKNNDTIETDVGEHHVLQRMLKSDLYFYMDDLDRWWTPNKNYANRLKGLILALGDMTSDMPNFKARISMRTDVYDYINTDEEFFDKYETAVVLCKWENADILKVLIKRIASYFEINIDDNILNSSSQRELSEKYFPPLIKTFFKDTRVWNGKRTYRVLMSLTRGVPRDIVKLLNAAAKNAYENNRNTIEPKDICDILDEYSKLRLKDISREFHSELQCVQELLLNMGPSQKEKKKKKDKRYLYTTSELQEKIKQAVERIGTVHFSWTPVPAPLMELSHFLYKIGFITARRDYPSKIVRTNYDKSPSLLTRKSGDQGYSWEIHPAYRAALYTYDPEDITWQSTIEISDSDDE